MKTLVLSILVTFMFTTAIQAQTTKRVEKSTKTLLMTKYYDNGQIYEQGTLNTDGQLHGLWKRYDEAGNVLVQGTYQDGMKEGKWLFWSVSTLKEVDFAKNKLVKYSQWNKTDYLASH